MASPALDLTLIASGREAFAAFVGDDGTQEVMTQLANEHGWSESRVLNGGVTEAIQVLADVPTPELLVVDLTGADDPLAAIDRLAAVCDENTRVIALGELNDITLYRSLIDQGVEEYLLKPISAPAIEAAVTAAPRQKGSATQEVKNGRQIVVVGARGGVGSSTVAVNLAWLMATDQNLRVAVIDFDLYFGTIALSLDLEPGRGFRDALANPGRIDGLFIERAMVRVSDNFFVLASETSLDQPVDFDPVAAEMLVEHLRQEFDCIVAEVPRGLLTAYPSLLSAADSALVVSDLSLAGMRDTVRLAEFVKNAAPVGALKVVANRAGAVKKGELSKEEFQKTADLKIDCVLPQDLKPAVDSVGAGKPMAAVAGRSKVVSGLRLLSRELSGVEPVASTSPLKRLFKR